MTVSIVGTILLYAAAVALFMFVTREQPRWKRRLAWFAIATALALALIVFLRFTLPVRAFAILAAVALFVGVPVAAVLGLGLLAASRLVKVVRMEVAAERARGYELTPTEEKLPAAVDEERAEMESLGFHVIVSGHAADGSPHILLLHASGSIMGEVVQYLSISTDRPIVEFTSITADRRGIVETGNFGLVPDLWPAQLRQTLPGAGTPQLLVEHQRALAFLERRGVSAQHLTPEEALEARSWGLDMSNSAVLAAPARALLRSLARTRKKGHVGLGPLEHHPGIEDRIRRLTEPSST